MNRFMSLLATVLVAAGAAAAADTPLATDTPRATIETLHAGLVAAARDAGTGPIAERYERLEPIVEATHDLPYIAEFALRRQWPGLSADQRARFVAVFSRLSVSTYASRFRNLGATALTIASVGEPTGERVEVTATIARPEGGDVPLQYLLERRDGQWRIINIVADGVSDLALKRAEYQRILATGSIDDLIASLEAQMARLE